MTPPSSPPAPPPAQAPTLSHAELREELDRVFSKHRRSMLVAFYGAGEAGTLALPNGQRFEVIPTQSELLLRERLPAPGSRGSAAGDGVAYLVDWATSLPLDISARLAGGRLRHLARETRLAGLFGAYQVAPDLMQSALLRALLKRPPPQPLQKVTAQVLQRGDAFRRLLQAQLGVSLDRTANLTELVRWCVWADGGKDLRRLADADEDWRALREELRRWLRDQWGPLAQAAWIAWEHEAGWRFAAFCALIEAWQEAARGQPDLLRYGRGLLTGHLSQDPWGGALLDATQQLADPTLMDALLQAPPDLTPACSRQELLARAQTLIADADFTRDVVSQSRRLPLGYTTRRDALAAALSRLPSAPTTPALRAAVAAWEALTSHQDAAPPSPPHGATDEDPIEMGLRLAAYLVQRAARPTDSAHKTPAYVEALELAELYAREGGHLDHARALLRAHIQGADATPSPPAGAPPDALRGALQAVLAAADALRDGDDARFASGLSAWLDAGCPEVPQVAAASALPDMMRSWAHSFLQERPHRRLLLITIRGLSSAEATRLRQALQDEPDRWQTMSWRPDKYKATPGLPAILSPWPTDADKALSALLSAAPTGALTPTLIDAPLDGVDLRAATLATLQDEAKRLVCVTLTGSAWRDNHHKPLRDLLLAAAAADRAALLVSDQGWIPGDRLKPSQEAAAQPGGRWRARRKPSAKPLPAEVTLRTPSGEAFALWDCTACHGLSAQGAPRAWGGASLAEVVLPALWLAPQRLAASIEGGKDSALSTRPLEPPPWWRPARLMGTPPTPPPTPPTLLPAPTHPPTAATQGALLPPPTQTPPQLKRADHTEGADAADLIAQALKGAEAFKQHIKRRRFTAQAVEDALLLVKLLIRAGGSISSEQLGDLIGEPPRRVRPWVNEVRKVFTLEGYCAIEMDAHGTRARLNEALLLQLFELEDEPSL